MFLNLLFWSYLNFELLNAVKDIVYGKNSETNNLLMNFYKQLAKGFQRKATVENYTKLQNNDGPKTMCSSFNKKDIMTITYFC